MPAYRALYRKWRPVRFEDVVGQQSIVSALQNQVRTNRMGHAYLFTGTRGTGKTSCAKIFAKAVNCPHNQQGDPCGQCETCKGIEQGSILDVVEIDAASNNGVDNIRVLREETAYTPSFCRYKVYIIDEVHMLSVPAFNALLKIMEEPPSHIIFILATTEIHKVPATILSRCQRYDFARISAPEIAKRLEYIAQQEQIDLSHQAAELIARLADGALRDALSILDTCASVSPEIDEQRVRQMAGVTEREYLFAISQAVFQQNPSQTLAEVANLRQKSVDLRRLTEELIVHYRNLLLTSISKDASLLVGVSPQEEKQYFEQIDNYTQQHCIEVISRLGKALGQMGRATDQRIELELALFELSTPKVTPQSLPTTFTPIPTAIKPFESKQIENTQQNPIVDSKLEPVNEPSFEIQQPTKPAQETILKEPVPFEQWNQIVDMLKTREPLLYSNLKDSRAFFDGKRVLIDGTPMFLEYIRNNQSKQSKEALKRTIAEVCGVRYGIGPYDKPKQKQEIASVSTQTTLDQFRAMGVEVQIKTTKHEGEDSP